MRVFPVRRRASADIFPPAMDVIADKDVAAVSLPVDLAACHAMISRLLDELRQVQRSNSQLEHQLQELLRRMYGRSSEKLDPNQMALFAGMLQELQTQQPAPAQQPSTSDTSSATAPVKTPHGRRRFPTDLPRRRIEHDLPEHEKNCPCCAKPRRKIGEVITEKLEYEPAKVIVLETVQFKYGCQDCDTQANNPQIVLAEKPPEAIEKCMAGPGLLAHVIVGKYSDHLPLHRLEKILSRHDIDIARSTMCDWMGGCAKALRPLYQVMIDQVLASKVIHTDDTPVDVLDKNRQNTRTGRFWVYRGDQLHPCTVFDYTPSRRRDGPVQFLGGWGREKKVYLQADAFGGYDGVYIAPSIEATAVPVESVPGDAGSASLLINAFLSATDALTAGIVEVACWAHARRKFYEARTSDPARSAQALAYIRLLYDVEDQARSTSSRQAKEKQLDVAARAALRREVALPRLNQFKEWLEKQQLSNGGGVLPKSPMGQAITYALNQWNALCVYVSDGDLAIDNNAAENALRRIALGRKNWLFCGSDAGGQTAAILFTMIATCDRHKVNAFEYLRDVLSRIATQPISKLGELLPEQWKAAKVASALPSE